uniref:alanine--tRNA ligase n=1 Tax=candidate division CPR3 bacterium TaxID=2268181 RepID=A0A7V3J9X5_UNCC3
MNMWSHQEIREAFLKYFVKHDHLVIGSSSLVPVNDPTLLLINSGMAPLKPFFTGEKVPPHKRLCNIQKCIRTNDIESVGDRHHLTFFEMMGNWSIGDYFKREAIELAWRMISEVFKFDTSRIYVTVYAGDNKLLGIPPDDESQKIWESLIPGERIVRLGAGSNFWGPAGAYGPCGPCTEVFFDRGENYGCGKSTCGPDCECGRFLEIWNAGVFMQYYLQEGGTFTELPFKSVDAGAGLDRFAVVLQGVDSVYETDLLKPILATIVSRSNLPADSRSTRIIVDHLRCSTFMIADGIRPANLGKEYILRRLLRRTFLHSKLAEIDTAVLQEATMIVQEVFSPYYPELKSVGELVRQILEQELSGFEKTLNRGLWEFDKIVSRSSNTISGDDAFKLHDTLGFPIEMTKELAHMRGLAIDEERFKERFEEHRSRSRGKI